MERHFSSVVIMRSTTTEVGCIFEISSRWGINTYLFSNTFISNRKDWLEISEFKNIKVGKSLGMWQEESRVHCGGAISASSFLPALLGTSGHRPMSHVCSWQADHRGEVWSGHLVTVTWESQKVQQLLVVSNPRTREAQTQVVNAGLWPLHSPIKHAQSHNKQNITIQGGKA